MKSFLRLSAESRVKENNLLKIDRLIDWAQLRLVLKNIERSGLGPAGYDMLSLLKALILQAWYSLSDRELEESLSLRLDFMLFTDLDDRVPDSSTICRFRNLLVSQGLLEDALKNINQQLEEQHLKVKPTEGAIIDATVIESAAAPRKTLETIPVDREEDASTSYEVSEVQLSADKDARWLKKRGKSYFGYKAFAVVGAEQGYIEKIATTPANVSECRHFKEAISGIETERMYADKGYASAENRKFLAGQGIQSGIMYMAYKNKPLGHWPKVFNKLVSKVRYKVEQAFGTLKRRFSFRKASYFGLAKVHGQCLLKAIAFNLLKAVNAL